MKRRQLFILLFLFASLFANAQSVQYGYTVEYRGAKDKRPLTGVNITAGGATAKSGENGKFRLEFNTLKVGDRVNVDMNNVVALKGYVLFNKEAVEQWTVSGKDIYFRIVLCRKKMFDDLLLRYYNVSDKSYKEQLRREKEKAKRLREQGKIQQQEYERLLREADERYQNAFRHIMENAELVARIDESELDRDEAEILRLAKGGKLDEAVELIKKSNTVELFAKTVRKGEYSSEQQAFYAQKEDEARQEMASIAKKMKTNIKILQLAGGKENLDLCGEYWLRIIAADSTNLSNLWYGAYFFSNQNDKAKAEVFYQKFLNIVEDLERDDFDKYARAHGNVLNNLAVLYTDLGQTKKAIKYHRKALDVRFKLVKAHPKSMKYGMDFIQTLTGLGNAYYSLNQYDDAEGKYKQVLRLDSMLMRYDTLRILPNLSSVMNNLAVLYRGCKRYELCEEYNLKALAIRRRLAASDPEYIEDISGSLGNLAALYIEQEVYDKAEDCCLEALSIGDKLARFNPDKYNADYALYLSLAGCLYCETGEFGKSEKYHQEALSIRRKLAEMNHDLFDHDLNESLTNLSLLYMKMEKPDLVLDYSRQSLAILRRLSQSNPDAYNPNLADALNNMVVYLCGAGYNEEAESCGKECVALYKELAMRDSARFMLSYARSLNLMASFYSNIKRYGESADYYEQTLREYRQLGETDSTLISEIMGALSYLKIFGHQLIESERYAREALLLDSSQVWIKTNLVSSLLLQGRYDEAETMTMEIVNEEWKGEPLKEILLRDLNEFEREGAIPEERQDDVERLRRRL